MEEKIIRITHYYSLLFGVFAVKTKYSLEELNQICAYLQLVRFCLPCFATVENVLGEDDVVNLLDKIYDCEKIVSYEQLTWHGEIELYENWDNYAVKTKVKSLNCRAAMPGVQLAIIERMLIQAREGVV